MEFLAAAAADSKWIDEIDNFEHGLEAVYRKANSMPEAIDIFDKILVVNGRSDLSLRQRLLEIIKLSTQARDLGRSVQ